MCAKYWTLFSPIQLQRHGGVWPLTQVSQLRSITDDEQVYLLRSKMRKALKFDISWSFHLLSAGPQPFRPRLLALALELQRNRPGGGGLDSVV